MIELGVVAIKTKVSLVFGTEVYFFKFFFRFHRSNNLALLRCYQQSF